MPNTIHCIAGCRDNRLLQWVGKKIVGQISDKVSSLKQSCQWYFEKRRIRRAVNVVSCFSRMRDPVFFDECFLDIVKVGKKSVGRQDEVLLMELLKTLSASSEYISDKNRAELNELAVAAVAYYEQKEDYTKMVQCMNHTMRLCSVPTSHFLAQKSISAASSAFDKKDTNSVVPLLMRGIYSGSDKTKILGVLCLCHLAYTSDDTEVVVDALRNATHYSSLVHGLSDLKRKIDLYRFHSGPNPAQTHQSLLEAAAFIFQNPSNSSGINQVLRFLHVAKDIIDDREPPEPQVRSKPQSARSGRRAERVALHAIQTQPIGKSHVHKNSRTSALFDLLVSLGVGEKCGKKPCAQSSRVPPKLEIVKK